MDPRGLAELVPDFAQTAPLDSPVTADAAYFLTAGPATAEEYGTDLPPQWRTAFERDREGGPLGNDPLPERRAGRALAAFIVTGLVFLALPGTFLGVCSRSQRARTAARRKHPWIQAHGQALLLPQERADAGPFRF